MFTRVLIANRGEIAVRISRTLRRMGIDSVAVYSDADASALHRRVADVAVRIGPAPARDSYLDISRVIAAARETGAEAIHPGYGFLSENAAFAAACEEAGVAFIGPRADVIAAMGDKIAAKEIAVAAGVPVVPGRHDPHMDDAALMAAVREVGFPALLKPAAGGGGKGMRVVSVEDDVQALISSARREAQGSFGDDRLLVERYVERPRHIEVQVIGDHHGGLVHLGERECTLQRRHQKVIEEAPSVLLDPSTRDALCGAALNLARAVGYTNAGTVEFVVPSARPGEFAFLEMNTRLQVEHPVTEQVTGLDLVELQLRVAAGEALGLSQDDIVVSGHAVEARVYAEDPRRDYLPTGGRILTWHASSSARVDAGVATGDEVSSHYDPMLAKVISHAATRQEAIDDLRTALTQSICLGVRTNIDDLADVLDDPRVRSGDMDTGVLAEHQPIDSDASAAVLAAAAPLLVPPALDDLWDAGDSWRLGGPAPQTWLADDHRLDIVVRARDASADTVQVDVDGVATPPALIDDAAFDGTRLWVHAGGRHHDVQVHRQRDVRVRRQGEENGHVGRWAGRSPMPGVVIDVLVSPGDRVVGGDALVVVEAMKMEHTVRAPGAGTVAAVTTSLGARVPLDAELVEIDLDLS